MAWKLLVLSLAVFGYSAAFVIRSPRDNNYGYEEYQCPTAAFLGQIFGELSDTFNKMAHRLERSPQMYNNHRSLRGHHGHRRGYGYHHLPPPLPPLPPPPPFAPRPYLRQQPYNGVPFAVNPWNTFPHRNPFLNAPAFPNPPPFSKPPGFTQGPQVSDFSHGFPHFAKNGNNNWNNSPGDFGPGKPITSQVPLQLQPTAKPRQNLQSHLQPQHQSQSQPQPQVQLQPLSQLQPQPHPQPLPQPQLQLQLQPEPQPQPQPQPKSQEEINDLLLEIFSPQGSIKNFLSSTESPADDLIQSVLGPSEKMEAVSKEDSGQSAEDVYPTFRQPGDSQKLEDWIQSVLLRPNGKAETVDEGDIGQPIEDISPTYSPFDNSEDSDNWFYPKKDTSDQSRVEDSDIR